MKTAAFLAVLILTGIAIATSYPTVAPVAAIVVPHYAAGYTPPPAADDKPPAETPVPFTDADRSRMRRIEDKLDELIKLAKESNELPADPNKPAPAPAPNPKPPSPLLSAATVCAGCHHADVFENKGGGFQLFKEDGTFAKLAARDVKHLQEMVTAGKMPPEKTGRKLSDEEKAALIGAVTPK